MHMYDFVRKLWDVPLFTEHNDYLCHKSLYLVTFSYRNIYSEIDVTMYFVLFVCFYLL
jgi:hypothetical protein